MTTYTILLLQKEELSKFKDFKNLVEKQNESKLKCLRTDKDVEYTSYEFNECCRENNIVHQLTMPQNPQQKRYLKGRI